MTLALSVRPAPRSSLDIIRDFQDRVRDWGDPYRVAEAAAAVLVETLAHPTTSVYRYDADGEELVLLATLPAGVPGAAAVGTRSRLDGGLLAQAVLQQEVQRRINAYVEPDFVHSLPGETRSQVAVPIGTAAGAHGVVHLVYASPHRPDARDEETAELLASQLSLVLGAAASASAAPPAGDPEAGAVLARLASELAHCDDLPGALAQVAEGALRVVPAESALVLFRHAARQALEVVATAGAPSLAVGELLPLEGSAPGEVTRVARPRVWSAAVGDAGGFGEAGASLRDALVVPLCAGGKSYGALAVLNRRGDGPFGPDEVERLQGLANHAAAIEPMRQLGPLRQRLSDNSLIAEVGRAVTGTLGLDDVLALVVRAAEMLVGARGVALGVITDDGDALRLASTSGMLRRCADQVVPLHASLIGWAVLNAEQVVSPCVSDDPRGFPHDVRQGPGLVIPLESRGRIWGALMVTRAEGAAVPTEEDIDALRKLAAYASIAIDNANLYREQTDLSTALRAQTEELRRAYAELRESQERLVVSEKMAALGRITAGIAHEINSPLGGILNCLQLAHSYAGEYRSSIGDPEVTAQDHEGIAGDLIDAIEMAQTATRKVAQFVRTIKGQTRTGDEALNQSIDVPAEVEGVLTLLQHELRNRHVQVHADVEPETQLLGDPGQFSLVLQNLVNNAIDAYEGRAGEVWVRFRRQEDAMVLEVQDRGCGIPDAIRGRIFDYLFTTKDVGQGTGLGLSTVHSIVTSHFRGSIDLQSQVGAGTTFVVRFPASEHGN